MPRTLKLVLSPMGGRKRHRRVRGKGIFGDIWNGIKKVGSVANDIAKSTGIVSKGLSLIPEYGSVASNVAKSLGYGKKRRRKRLIRRRKVAPKKSGKKMMAGGMAGHTILPGYVSFAGMGKKKKRVVRHKKGAGVGAKIKLL